MTTSKHRGHQESQALEGQALESQALESQALESRAPQRRPHKLLESGARYDEDSPGQHYRSAGISLIAIGSTIMFMAVWMYLIEREDTQQDHVSNMLVAALIMVTGFWLKSHEHEELD